MPATTATRSIRTRCGVTVQARRLPDRGWTTEPLTPCCNDRTVLTSGGVCCAACGAYMPDAMGSGRPLSAIWSATQQAGCPDAERCAIDAIWSLQEEIDAAVHA